MTDDEAYEAGCQVVVDGRTYVPLPVYDRIVDVLQEKLRHHVSTLERIDAELRSLEQAEQDRATARQAA